MRGDTEIDGSKCAVGVNRRKRIGRYGEEEEVETPTSGASGACARNLDTLLVEVVLGEGGHGCKFCARAEWGSVGKEKRKMEKGRGREEWRREEWRREKKRREERENGEVGGKKGRSRKRV